MIYCYNIETGEYSMTMPFENEVGEGKTDIAPPKLDNGQVAVFDVEKQKWDIFNDYRFTHKLLEINDSEYIITNIDTLGEPLGDYQLITNEQAKIYERENFINKLTMTSLDFIKYLRSVGLTLDEINQFLNENEEIKIELQYCSNVYCGVAKSHMPINIGNIDITAEIIEHMFIEKNKDKYTEFQKQYISD